ncbi:MAG: hypothetical protein JNM25_07505 [Planctomycetes bacterium]|nr:hypothetical protein [Planctomycetota bacterium]
MNIHDIGKSGNVDRSGDRTTRAGVRNDVLVPFVPKDEAKISASSRQTAAAIGNLTERARQDGDDRASLVAAALERLQSGALDQDSVYGATAQKLLDAKFLSG